MSIKTFRIVLDGVTHEVEVEEIKKDIAQSYGFSTSLPSPSPTINKIPSPPIASQKETSTSSSTLATNDSNSVITAPLQGTVQSIHIKEGQQVKSGELLIIIEAMKMENEIVSPKDGIITALCVSPSSTVASGDVLVKIS